MNAIVVIAASAGGFAPLRRIIDALPGDSVASVCVVMHTGPRPSLLPPLLANSSRLPVTFAQDGATIEPGHIYVAPPDYHILLESNRIRLDHGPKIHHTRPAADPLFISAAEAFAEKVIGIVLSRGDSDGTAGLQTIKQRGGIALVQDPAEAQEPAMPQSAIAGGHPDACLPVEEIAHRVAAFCKS